jgi:nicotinamidase-related amidase
MPPFPAFYNPQRIGALVYPDTARIAAEADAAALAPARDDARNIHLLLIDMQVDFCHPHGSLYVPGALGDVQRTVEFIYRNAAQITQITCSLDSHLPSQIFSPNWWADADGQHPAPFTIISAADVQRGRWRARFEPAWSADYVARLEQEAKKLLTIWPYHVLIGSPGHMLDPELWSAVMWHALARQTQPRWLAKGSEPRTEHYSIVQPEVPLPGMSDGGRNQALLDELSQADMILVAGEALSHCVLETVEDLVEAFSGQPELLRRIHLLRDCTSPVVHSEIDFGAIAAGRLAAFQQMGVRLVDSTEIDLSSQ